MSFANRQPKMRVVVVVAQHTVGICTETLEVAVTLFVLRSSLVR